MVPPPSSSCSLLLGCWPAAQGAPLLSPRAMRRHHHRCWRCAAAAWWVAAAAARRPRRLRPSWRLPGMKDSNGGDQEEEEEEAEVVG